MNDLVQGSGVSGMSGKSVLIFSGKCSDLVFRALSPFPVSIIFTRDFLCIKKLKLILYIF